MAVYDEEKTKHDSELDELERSFESPSATQSGSDIARRNAETQQLEDAFNAPSAETSGSAAVAASKKKAEGAAELRDKEAEAPDQLGEGYTDDGKKHKKSGWMNKKRASIVGAVLGVSTLGTILLMPIGGVLEFFQFANAIQIPHFSNNELFSDGRLGKLFVYSRTKSVGDTRLNWLERTYKNKILADMEKVGLKPVADSHIPGASNLDHLKYWQFDTTSDRSPLRGMSPDEVKTWASDKLGLNAKDVEVLGNKSVYIKADGLVKGAKTSYLLNREMGYSKVVSAMRGRVLGKFFDIGFHPLRPLDEKINAKSGAYWKAFKEAMDKRRTTYIKEGVKPITIDTSKAQQTDGKDGKATALDGTTTEVNSESKSGLKAFLESPGGKLAGGALLGAGMVCAARAVADGVGDFKQTQVIEPAMRTGMEIISLRDQIANGATDVDMKQVNYYADQFTTIDSQGNTVNSWSQAKSIVSNNGGSGGVDLPAETKSGFIAGIPDWLQWTQSKPVDVLCSGAGQIVQGVIGIASLATGGVVTGIVSVIGGAVVFDQVISRTTDWLSGQAFKMSTGAVLGGQADYGAFFASNSVAMEFGGMPISSTTVAQTNGVMASIRQDEFSQEPLTTKLFSRTDTRSLVARVALSLSAGKRMGPGGILSKLGNIPGQLAGFGSLLIPKSFAQTSNSTYDYGVKAAGWSLSEQETASIQDPIANADWVANLLNGGSGKAYIDKAYECFGISIEKGANGWTAIPKDASAFKATYAENKPCDTSGVDYDTFLRVRAFIADTATMEGYACLNGDDVSCSNSGFNG